MTNNNTPTSADLRQLLGRIGGEKSQDPQAALVLDLLTTVAFSVCEKLPSVTQLVAKHVVPTLAGIPEEADTPDDVTPKDDDAMVVDAPEDDKEKRTTDDLEKEADEEPGTKRAKVDKCCKNPEEAKCEETKCDGKEDAKDAKVEDKAEDKTCIEEEVQEVKTEECDAKPGSSKDVVEIEDEPKPGSSKDDVEDESKPGSSKDPVEIEDEAKAGCSKDEVKAETKTTKKSEIKA
ncbi:hypothetical protein CJU90_1545 [Yarrowia sp. C11]|nr:hypothetical protein CKK34_0269 [Yarrowia sp. E02]KAG5371511.1 hypothetical protein CJU90_1545 [Yarrowia sp. C11]